jgi:hypothetical protein
MSNIFSLSSRSLDTISVVTLSRAASTHFLFNVVSSDSKHEGQNNSFNRNHKAHLASPEYKQKKVDYQLARPTKDKDKVKTKNVKITEECHRLIGRMGFTYEDFGDVVFRAVKHYASCPRAKGEKEGHD